MPPFELGFSQSQGRITEVVQGSRAAEAGLRGGDRVMETSELKYNYTSLHDWNPKNRKQTRRNCSKRSSSVGSAVVGCGTFLWAGT
jgi:hypothetical protein